MSSLIVSEHEFERKWHRFEQIAWVVLTCILIAAALGVLGRGRLATRTAVARDGSITVTYDRVLRARSTADLEIMFESQATRSGEAKINFSSPISVRQMMPPPVDARASRGAAGFTFRAEPPLPARVRLVQAPEVPGRYRTNIGPVVIEQIILP
jgi:hypothetical protein